MIWGIKCITQKKDRNGFEHAFKTERGYEVWFKTDPFSSLNAAFKFMHDHTLQQSFKDITYLVEEK